MPPTPEPGRSPLPSIHPAFVNAAGILLIALGVWTLPLQYFTEHVTTRYPTELKLLLGTWALAAGIGVLRRARWGRWLGLAFLATQLASVATTGFRYDAVFAFGLTVRFPWGGEPLELQVNFLALAALVVLLAAGNAIGRGWPEPRVGSRRT